MQTYSAESVKVILVCIGFGGFLIYTAIRNHRRVRKISDTPRSKASSAPQGYVEIEGFAWPVEKTISSKSGAEAVYYQFQLQKEETKGSGKNRRKTWVTVYARIFGDPFYVVDATGLTLLDPSSAELNIDGGKTTSWKVLPPEEKKRILEKVIDTAVPSFPPSTGFLGLFSSNYRVVEKEILVGCPVYASGDFRTEVEACEIKSHGLTSFAKKVFNGEARSLKNVSGLLDTNRDGKVTENEMKVGYSMAARTSRVQNPKEEEIFRIYGNLASSPEHKLFIADAFEEQIKARVGRFLWLRLGGGAAMMTFGLFYATGGQIDFEIPAPKRAVASSENLSSRLHRECVSGNATSCEQMLLLKSNLQLGPEHLKYYRTRACGLGKKEFCP